MQSRKIVLASTSPRRKSLLKNLGIKFEVIGSNFEEKNSGLSSEELVVHNAIGKAQSVAQDFTDAIVIGADTVGDINGKTLGKPKDNTEAEEMVKSISGSKHKVISAICLYDTKKKELLTGFETTYITMDKLSDRQIQWYINSGEGKDKAAGYAIQGKGALFIRGIEGDYLNVVGMPINLFKRLMVDLGAEEEIFPV